VTLYKAKQGQKRFKKVQKVRKLARPQTMSKFSQGQKSSPKYFFSRVVMASIANFTGCVFSIVTFFDLVSLPTSSQAQKGHKLFVKLLMQSSSGKGSTTE
jgi:hypothetical protein